MFDSGDNDGTGRRAPGSDWTFPGRPVPPAGPVTPDPCAVALVEAVDALLGQDVGALDGPVALERCRTVLAQSERLGAAGAVALADVQARELWTADAAGSLVGWLRQQPCGDAGRITRSGRLPTRPHVLGAVATGTIGVSTADVVCKALSDLPATCEPGQVEGVLTRAVPELLSSWTARNALDPSHDPVADARAALLRDTIDQAVADITAAPAARLEQAFVLVAQALNPTVLACQLQLLVDALLPEQLAADEQKAYDNRGLVLRKKKLSPGYRISGDLTDEVGGRLQAEFDARAAVRKQTEAKLRKAAQNGKSDLDAFGTVGPGTPTTGPGLFGSRDDEVLDGPPLLTDEQLAHDLLGEILDDLADVREPGTPAPTTITVHTDLDTLEGRFGALPGTMLLPNGPFPLSLEGLRRMGCDSRLNAVLLDAARTPIGASGTHRHATDKERRALRALWGDYCAVNGCPCTDTVPHHVPPWWRTGRTKLKDLVPICKSNHHDVHDGHRTLRLRDGRLIDENGWVIRNPPEPPDDRMP